MSVNTVGIVDTKKDARIEFRLPSALLRDLREIEAKTKIAPQSLLRGLADEAVAFFRTTGGLSFPLHIVAGERPALLKRARASS